MAGGWKSPAVVSHYIENSVTEKRRTSGLMQHGKKSKTDNILPGTLGTLFSGTNFRVESLTINLNK